MKKTTINITGTMEAQVTALIARAARHGGRLGMAEIVREAVAMMHAQLIESGTSYWPVYTEVFINAEKDDLMRIKVRGHSEDGSYTDYLKRAESLEEAMAAPVRYIEVKHPLKYPFAKYDYDEDVSEKEKSRFAHVFGVNYEPRMFAEAGVVFTPKMALL